jgi:ribosomal protein S12 methylthiotransferase accessory factor
VAAHTDFGEARRRALAELIERDAFMWTWVQRVSRELLEPDSLSPDLLERVRKLERDGVTVSFVNLTLDTAPVILCVASGPARLQLGCSCHPDAAAAAAKAFSEAARQTSFGRSVHEPIEGTEVATPTDHLRFHQSEARRPDHEFLFASSDRISTADVTGVPAPLEEAVRVVGDPLFADLSHPSARPFVVARALVPGLVPISFGWDREPLGMPRLARPVRLGDGRTIGKALHLNRIGPIMPHPFP